MTKLCRCMTICCLFLGVLLLAGTSGAQTRPAVVEQLAKTYGLDSYGQVDAIRYTFNLQLPALNVNLSRTWVWEPKTGQVTYEAKDKDGKPVKVTYLRSQINNAPANVKDEIEPAFVNDNYWMISRSMFTGTPARMCRRRTTKNCRWERLRRSLCQ